ncbi:rcc01693 family protein [Roseitranquillus sediminis]|uniref:rcc01693 family protein n=1 Tax=Roseitranquillus sediminis TaxID=2809051 RepID=UPI001D0C1C3B|nr:rcc01693 family protein [Roseitranquillus sediminis]MBM9595206.1 phage tail assembly chaperone [Roseitranquillus sediminis]
MSRFDWPGLMRAGCRGLGLTPQQFWQLTPVELLILLGRDVGQAPLNRQRLEELARAFPDRKEP